MSDHALQAFLDEQDAHHEEYMEHLADLEEERQLIESIPERYEQQRELFIEDYAMARAGGRR